MPTQKQLDAAMTKLAHDDRKARYTVNGKMFGCDYATANVYWQIHGGILMEKLDSMTPWHVLRESPLTHNR